MYSYKKNKVVVYVHSSQSKYSILQGREGILEILRNFVRNHSLGVPYLILF